MSMKTIIITGGSSGIGFAAVQRFIANNFRVVVLDIQQPPSEIESENIDFYNTDVTNKEDVINTFSAINEKYEKIHYLISNAGGAIKEELDGIPDVDTFEKSINLNLTSHYRIVNSALPFLQTAENDRCVIFTSSVNAIGAFSLPAYSSAKSGLLGLTRTLADELAPNIRVNTVLPGTILTPAAREEKSRDELNFQKNGTMLNKLGKPDDIADSFEAIVNMTHMTGQTLTIDGGQSIISPGAFQGGRCCD